MNVAKWIVGVEDLEQEPIPLVQGDTPPTTVESTAPVETEVSPVQAVEGGAETPVIAAAPAEPVATDLTDVVVPAQAQGVAVVDVPTAPEGKTADELTPPDTRQPEVSIALEDEQCALEEPSNSVETRLVEVSGIDGEMERLLADGEQLATDTESLEATADVVADAAAGEGVDATTARAVEVAVESFCSRWDVKIPKVAVESFVSTGTRKQASRVACESLVEGVAKAWDVFVKFLKELVAKIAAVSKSISGIGLSIKERVAKLEVRLGKLSKDGAAGSPTISGDFLNNLVIAGKLDPAKTMTALDDLVNKSDASYQSLAGALGKMSTGKVPSGLSGTIALGVDSKAPMSGLVPSGASDVKVTALPNSGYMAVFVSGESLRVDYVRHPGSVKTDKTNTPSIEEMNSIVAKLKSISEIISSKSQDAIERLNTAIEAAGTGGSGASLRDAIKSGDNAKVQAARETVTRLRSGALAAGQVVKIVNDGIRYANIGLIGYVQAGIAAHAGGDKAKVEPEAKAA